MSEEFNTEVASIMIRQALEDLEATENKEYFEVDMSSWISHENRYKNIVDDNSFGPIKTEFTRICNVCFAGSVMSNRLGVLKDETTPNDFDSRTANCLSSLDSLKSYYYSIFLSRFYPNKSRNTLDLVVNELRLSLIHI